MKNPKRFSALLFTVSLAVILIGSAMLAGGCSEDDEGTNPVVTPKTPLAYIYASDSTAGVAARSLLTGYDMTVRLVEFTQVAANDFAGDSLILVDGNTENYWDDPDAVAAVENSGKPVIAMGEGGYDLFGEFGLNIGSPHGAHDERAQVKMSPACSCLVSTPHQITVPVDSLVNLYSSNSPVVDIYTPPITVTIFAILPTDDRYTEIAEEQGRFLFWGFGGPVTQMTTDGSHLFVNTITYMLSK